MPDMEWSPLLAVVGLAALAIAVAFLRRTRGPWPGLSGRTQQLQVVERAALTPQHGLHLVRVRDRLLLVATCPGSTALLETMAEAPAISERSRS